MATSLIVKRAGYQDIAQSCARAELHKPCMRCAKCMRKGMLDDVLINGSVREETVAHFIELPIGKQIMTNSRIHNHTVMIYIASHYQGKHKEMQLFKKRIGADRINVDWLEKWYQPSVEVIAPPYRAYVTEQIKKYVEVMDEKERALLESWDIESIMSGDEYNRITQELIELLNS